MFLIFEVGLFFSVLLFDVAPVAVH